MKAVRAFLRGQHRGRLNLLPVVAGLCLILLAMLSVAQVTHLHSSAVDADHCQLCTVMHAAVPVTATAGAVVLVQMGASEPQAEPVFVARQLQTCLFIRPPPASC